MELIWNWFLRIIGKFVRELALRILDVNNISLLNSVICAFCWKCKVWNDGLEVRASCYWCVLRCYGLLAVHSIAWWLQFCMFSTNTDFACFWQSYWGSGLYTCNFYQCGNIANCASVSIAIVEMSVRLPHSGIVSKWTKLVCQPLRSTQPSILHGTVKWISVFGLSDNNKWWWWL